MLYLWLERGVTMRKLDIRNLYYITHIDNLPSILERGILSHDRIQEERVQSTRIYNTEIVNSRKEKSTPDQKSLWRYANLYFQGAQSNDVSRCS